MWCDIYLHCATFSGALSAARRRRTTVNWVDVRSLTWNQLTRYIHSMILWFRWTRLRAINGAVMKATAWNTCGGRSSSYFGVDFNNVSPSGKIPRSTDDDNSNTDHEIGVWYICQLVFDRSGILRMIVRRKQRLRAFVCMCTCLVLYLCVYTKVYKYIKCTIWCAHIDTPAQRELHLIDIMNQSGGGGGVGLKHEVL